jgi:hypothetical protein
MERWSCIPTLIFRATTRRKAELSALLACRTLPSRKFLGTHFCYRLSGTFFQVLLFCPCTFLSVLGLFFLIFLACSFVLTVQDATQTSIPLTGSVGSRTRDLPCFGLVPPPLTPHQRQGFSLILLIPPSLSKIDCSFSNGCA